MAPMLPPLSEPMPRRDESISFKGAVKATVKGAVKAAGQGCRIVQRPEKLRGRFGLGSVQCAVPAAGSLPAPLGKKGVLNLVQGLVSLDEIVERLLKLVFFRRRIFGVFDVVVQIFHKGIEIWHVRLLRCVCPI